MKKKKDRKTLIIVIAIVVIIILAWGIIGSSKAKSIGVDCTFGVGKDGSYLCWTWENNFLGDIGNAINNWKEANQK